MCRTRHRERGVLGKCNRCQNRIVYTGFSNVNAEMPMLDTAAAVFDVAYRILAFIYMLLASEHYLRTNHAWLWRRRRVNK